MNILGLNVTSLRLLVLLFTQGERFNDWAVERQLKELGTKKRKALYDARKELEAAGWITTSTTLKGKMLIHLHNVANATASAPLTSTANCPILPPVEDNPSCINKYNIYNILHDDVKEPVERVEHLGVPNLVTGQKYQISTSYPVPSRERVTSEGTGEGLPGRERVTLEVPGTEKGTGYLEGNGSKVLSLLERCEEVDEMDNSGEIGQRKSPAQQRRKAQIPLVQEAFTEFFPQAGTLTEKNAKLFLSWNDESAAQVYEELKAIAQRKPDLQYPLGYVSTVFQGNAGKAKAPITSTAPAYTPRPGRGAEAYMPGGDLPLPTKEYLDDVKAAREEFERLKKERGWLE